jgi:hypothetical protein
MLSLLFRSGAPQSRTRLDHSSVNADSPVVFQLEMSRVIVHRSEWVHSSQTKHKTQAQDSMGTDWFQEEISIAATTRDEVKHEVFCSLRYCTFWRKIFVHPPALSFFLLLV